MVDRLTREEWDRMLNKGFAEFYTDFDRDEDTMINLFVLMSDLFGDGAF